ncbi:MAG: YIP1 family protein [Candidatus Izemoplasmatales bacterium]|nr:YIP1 family protein [Candidatus Izemoplasmatales bacterium]MDD5292760.1 YIP1 family protein [Candidatus Izemoplasmatales bacterium]
MKKLLCLLTLTTLLIGLTPCFTRVKADSEFWNDHYPYSTYTIDYEGKLTYTQTAFMPLGRINPEGSLNNPQDIYIDRGLIYIADSGNKRIAVFDYQGNLVREIGKDHLKEPTGVFVYLSTYVFIADKGNQKVYKFDLEGNYIREYGRPTEPLFGSTSLYVPIKVVVGAGENIYVIGDGSTSGVIQLNYDGSFLGYFGVNLSSKSLLQKIADIFVVEDAYAANTPPSPTNIAINNKSLVYTATPNTEFAIKKLDVNGTNILTMQNYNREEDVVDLSVNDLGFLYAVYSDGLIAEYDPAGNLLFAFDVMSQTSNIFGQIKNPTGIAIDPFDRLFVLDGSGNQIFAYQPTDFAALVHDAIVLNYDGEYQSSTSLFERIIAQNTNFALAHAALGKAYFQMGNYDDALAEYHLANDVQGYSETFWQVRDVWLKDNLTWIFIVFIALYAFVAIMKTINKKTPAFAGIHQMNAKIKANPVVKEYTLAIHMLKHPIDGFFQIKRLHRGSVWSATLLLVLMFIEYLLMIRFTGYIFNNYSETINLGAEMAKFFGAVGLFVFCNYLISTLSDGEGWLKDFYIGTIYAMSPLLFGMIPLMLLSRVLTVNETIIYQIASSVLYGWTAILIFLSIKEIHNYEIKETFKNLLMTMFTMAIIVLIGFIIYAFGSQLWNFLVSWFKEAINRVRG